MELLRRPSLLELPYIVAPAVLALIGDTTGHGALILIGILVTVPCGIPAVIAYYGIYGFAAQLPGANPNHSSGMETCSANDVCSGSSSGDAATWLTVWTGIAGLVLLVAAAVGNVILYRLAVQHARGAERVG